MHSAGSRQILGVRVDATTYSHAVTLIRSWAEREESRFVTASTVNNLVQAQDDESYKEVLDSADLVTPDGMPLVWGLRALGIRDATRVYGPELMWRVCAMAEHHRVPVGFYGGAPDVLDTLIRNVTRRHPLLDIAYAWAPPFRDLSPAERIEVDEGLRGSGAAILFVGLGGAKQDRWIAARRGELPAVMLAVGAAFDFLSGAKPQAPVFMQKSGTEWLFRLATEPRRLWRRYLLGNPRFIWLFTRQLIQTPRLRQKRLPW